MALPPILQRVPLPIIGAPLFIISHPQLVIAQCKAGVVGSMPALNARPASQLDDWLAEITETLAAWDRDHPGSPAAPFAVNQIVHKSNDRLEQDMAVCAKYKVPIVITSLGARSDVFDAVHGWGGVVLHDIINNAFAPQGGGQGRRRPRRGGRGRRRPRGRQEPVRAGAGDPGVVRPGRWPCPAPSPPEMRWWRHWPWAPTSPTSARPSSPPPRLAPPTAYKQCIVDSNSDDIVYSSLFTGVHGNYLKPSIRNAGLDPDHLPESDPSKMDFGGGEGSKKAWKDIWGCGQGIGAVKAVVPVAQRVAQWRAEMSAACQRLAATESLARLACADL